MAAQPQDSPAGDMPIPETSLRAIRAALVVPQDRDAFDAGLKAVLDEVRVSLDLGVLNDFVYLWWLSACDSVNDPEGRRRMHAVAERIQSGETVPSRSVREVFAEREARG
jgi:hypothetical protein